MLMGSGTNAPVVNSPLARGTGVFAWEVDFVVTSRSVFMSTFAPWSISMSISLSISLTSRLVDWAYRRCFGLTRRGSNQSKTRTTLFKVRQDANAKLKMLKGDIYESSYDTFVLYNPATNDRTR